MAVTIEAVFDGEAFHPTTPPPLTPNRRYLLTIGEPQDQTTEASDAWDVLAALAGSLEAPPDWASEHDHYLTGSPKRSAEGESASPSPETADG